MNFDLHDARTLLARTPGVLRALLDDLPAGWLDVPERPDAWSARDVACHMADLERDAWLPRIRTILDPGTDLPLAGVERERFREHYRDAPIDVVLADFAHWRSANLDALRGLELDPVALAATGRHPVFGDVTLSQLLSTWVVHDLTHIAQITRALAARYRDDVGPWQQFLSVLRQNPA